MDIRDFFEWIVEDRSREAFVPGNSGVYVFLEEQCELNFTLRVAVIWRSENDRRVGLLSGAW